VSGSANGGRATIKSIGIGKDINALSPAIFQRLALNQVMYQVEIVHANADNSGSAKIFLLQRFRNVVLTKLKHVGTATSANDPAKEALEISCTKYFTEYTSYNASGSTSKTSAGFAFDTLANWNGL
jgi:type VI protein secretion system component Hcp